MPTDPENDETEIAAPGSLVPPGSDNAELFRELAADDSSNYRPVRELGSGGMGAVFLAEQTEPVRRLVALKVIKLGMDTREIVSRFESERQALAVMDHPSIAHVYDAGATSSGRPFFVMEYVDGLPLTKYCARHDLGVRERLGLFIDVCRGVQHAHQKGVIHRDLKPSNILVASDADRPLPKIIDFGVAKATGHGLGGETMATAAGVWIGTPAYMSPEQAGMVDVDIDTRTDIYSLGVVLYELLTGMLPVDPRELGGVSLIEFQRIIQKDTPQTPSARLRTAGHDRSTATELRGDLDWIVMRALEKERSRRYETANGLALDVERYLRKQPIEARPPSRSYRARKFVDRNRLGVGLAAALLLVLAAGMSGTGVGFLKARREARRASVVGTFLKDMLLGANPDTAQDRDFTVREMLDNASKDVGSKFANTPRVEAEIREVIGDMYVRLGQFDLAGEHLARASALYEETLGRGHPSTLRTMNLLAINSFESRRYSEAAPVFRKLADGYEQELGPEDEATLTALQNLAAAHLKLGEYEQCEPLFRRVLSARVRVHGPFDGRTMATKGNLAHTYLDTGRIDAAEPLFAETFAVRQLELGPRHPRTLISEFNLGDLHLRADRPERAEPLFRSAREGFARVLNPHHPYTLEATLKLAETRFRLGARDEAEALAAEAHAGWLEREGPDGSMTEQARELLDRVRAD